MRFEENPVAAEVFLRQSYEEMQRRSPRAPGLHATDLIFCTRKGWYKQQPEYPQPEPTVTDLGLWLSGHGMHQVLQMQPAGQADLESEIHFPCLECGTSHTATANLDCIETDIDGTYVLPVEVKSTRKSASATFNDVGYYVEQLCLYLLRWGTVTPGHDVESEFNGRLYVAFLCGDYKAIRTVVFKCWDIAITYRELQAWYRELIHRAHVITTSPTPPLPERYAWECDYCEYASAKGGPCTQDVLSKGRDGDKTGIKKTPFLSVDPYPDPIQEVPIHDGE